MRIGELAQRTELSTSRIRYYEANALLPQVKRAANGYRDYPESAVDTLILIRDAQQLGFSLSEIRAGLAHARGNLPSKPDMLEALQTKLTSLDRHLEQVAVRRRRIIEFINELSSHIDASTSSHQT